MTLRLAIDFGTSNTAAACCVAGDVRHIQLETNQATIPTAVFFPQSVSQMEIGTRANSALIQGEEGRYMRALKSVLGTSLMPEQRLLGRKRLDFYDVISAFLRDIKLRSEDATGLTFDAVLSGRPVRFHSIDEDRNAQAEKDLLECYRRAGFSDIQFCPEPEAAAYSLGGKLASNRVGLVVDIGGGTSDFTVFKSGSPLEVIASYGVRIGGTDFDRILNYTQVMPHFGRGHSVQSAMGGNVLSAPNHIFHDLSRWEKIPFVYDPASLKFAKELLRDSIDKTPFTRLVELIEYQYGHDLAFDVEAAKIQSNATRGCFDADLDFLAQPISIEISYQQMMQDISALQDDLVTAMRDTVTKADLDVRDIQDIVLVGGSSLMGFVVEAINQVFDKPEIHQDTIFTAIVDGLAIQSTK